LIKSCDVVHCKHCKHCNACKILLMMQIRLPSIYGECTTPHLCLPSVAKRPLPFPFPPRPALRPGIGTLAHRQHWGRGLCHRPIYQHRIATSSGRLGPVSGSWGSGRVVIRGFGAGRRIDRHIDLCSEVWIRFPLVRAINQRLAVHCDSR